MFGGVGVLDFQRKKCLQTISHKPSQSRPESIAGQTLEVS